MELVAWLAKVERAETMRAPGDCGAWSPTGPPRRRETGTLSGGGPGCGRLAAEGHAAGTGDPPTGGGGAGHAAEPHAVQGQTAAAAGGNDSPGGGLLEKVSNARVGTLLCLVDVRGEACMCSRRLGACTVHGAGNSA